MHDDRLNILSEENLRKLVDYIRDGKPASGKGPSPDEIMNALNEAFTERNASQRKNRKRPSTLSMASLMNPKFLNTLKNTSAAPIEEQTKEPAREPATVSSLFEDGEQEDEIRDFTYREHSQDSIELARAIRYEISLKGSKYKPTKTMISAVMYIIYGHWLCLMKEVLLNEPPRVMQYGPVFVRAYNKSGNPAPALEYAAHSSMKKNSPQLFALMRESVSEYIISGSAAYKKRYLGKGSPWETATRLRPGEWGMKMDDEQNDIWFYKIIENKRQNNG
jgi:hypothetical protein